MSEKVVLGVPEKVSASLRKILQGLQDNDWTILYSYLLHPVEAEYYSDPKRADQIKTPAHTEVLLDIGVVATDRNARVEIFLSAPEGKPFKLELVKMGTKELGYSTTKTQKGLVEWLSRITLSESTPEIAQGSLF